LRVVVIFVEKLIEFLLIIIISTLLLFYWFLLRLCLRYVLSIYVSSSSATASTELLLVASFKFFWRRTLRSLPGSLRALRVKSWDTTMINQFKENGEAELVN
jgi:hypothetical protein